MWWSMYLRDACWCSLVSTSIGSARSGGVRSMTVTTAKQMTSRPTPVLKVERPGCRPRGLLEPLFASLLHSAMERLFPVYFVRNVRLAITQQRRSEPSHLLLLRKELRLHLVEIKEQARLLVDLHRASVVSDRVSQGACLPVCHVSFSHD